MKSVKEGMKRMEKNKKRGARPKHVGHNRTRIVLELTPAEMEKLNFIGEKIPDAENRTALVRRIISMTHVILSEMNDGSSYLSITDKDGETTRLLLIL